MSSMTMKKSVKKQKEDHKRRMERIAEENLKRAEEVKKTKPIVVLKKDGPMKLKPGQI